jgi:membrane protease YdiL (CAAX protease family)
MPTRPQSTKDPSSTRTTRSQSPLPFFLLVFALSIPFYLLDAWTGIELLEGLPISVLMTFVPLGVALILTTRTSGAEGVKALLARVVDIRQVRPKVWYAPALLTMPGISVLTYLLMRGLRLPLPPDPYIPLLPALAMCTGSLIAAAGEEGGWTGYALDRMQDRRSALGAALLLGLVGPIWHLPSFVQVGRAPAWIAWQSLFMVAARVLTVWLYNNTGRSVPVAALFHATINVSSFLFPNLGSHYDPRLAAMLTIVTAAIVTMGWGPQTLARKARREECVDDHPSVDQIRQAGYEWPKHPLIDEYAVIEEGQVDLVATLEKLRASRAFYRGQLNEAFAFKQNTGADYSDFTDRFDEYARMKRELGQAIAYLEEIVEALAP